MQPCARKYYALGKLITEIFACAFCIQALVGHFLFTVALTFASRMKMLGFENVFEDR